MCVYIYIYIYTHIYRYIYIYIYVSDTMCPLRPPPQKVRRAGTDGSYPNIA